MESIIYADVAVDTRSLLASVNTALLAVNPSKLTVDDASRVVNAPVDAVVAPIAVSLITEPLSGVLGFS